MLSSYEIEPRPQCQRISALWRSVPLRLIISQDCGFNWSLQNTSGLNWLHLKSNKNCGTDNNLIVSDLQNSAAITPLPFRIGVRSLLAISLIGSDWLITSRSSTSHHRLIFMLQPGIVPGSPRKQPNDCRENSEKIRNTSYGSSTVHMWMTEPVLQMP